MIIIEKKLLTESIIYDIIINVPQESGTKEEINQIKKIRTLTTE